MWPTEAHTHFLWRRITHILRRSTGEPYGVREQQGSSELPCEEDPL
jgi:hypothetical protein